MLQYSIDFQSNIKSYYVNRINKYRNKLGHTSLKDNSIEIDGESIPINQDLHKTLRKNIDEVNRILCNIEEHIENI